MEIQKEYKKDNNDDFSFKIKNNVILNIENRNIIKPELLKSLKIIKFCYFVKSITIWNIMILFF